MRVAWLINALWLQQYYTTNDVDERFEIFVLGSVPFQLLTPAPLNTINLLSFRAKRSSFICSKPIGAFLCSFHVKSGGDMAFAISDCDGIEYPILIALATKSDFFWLSSITNYRYPCSLQNFLRFRFRNRWRRPHQKC